MNLVHAATLLSIAAVSEHEVSNWRLIDNRTIIPGGSGQLVTDHERKPSEYYQHSGNVPFASRLSWRARQAIFERFLDVLCPTRGDRVLDLGVTCDTTFQESNFFEQLYPHPQNVTCVGTEDGSHLERAYPGVRFMPVVAGNPLPFPTGHFDIVFSNAVIEHAGNPQHQRQFVAEALRVSKRFFLSTPNRWFPVETHTGLPIVHYLPPPVFRALINRTRFRHWALEAHLNLLTAGSFAALFPPDAGATTEYQGVGFGLFRSNLVAYGHSATSVT
jgi:SAM-dependent methyltransferase